MRGSEPTLRRVVLSAAATLVVVLGAITLVIGFSDSPPLRVLQGLAVFAAGAVIVGGAVLLTLLHFAAWREPESEEEFELIVQRAERLAAAGSWGEADDDRVGGSGAYDEDEYALSSDEDFRALVRSAIDDLPLEFHRALEHVAIVVTDGGRERGAYGLYEGDTIAHDYFHDRILIFEDTLTRDFGHDPDRLRAQVSRTVRHELAHHLGWGERGVRGLGL